MDKCWYCNTTPYGDTRTIGSQRFNDKTISVIILNPRNPQLLTGITCNVPGKEGNQYRVVTKINYCPMCGRKLIDVE